MREEIEDIITLWDPRSGWVDGEKSVSECTEETLTCQSDKERVRENVYTLPGHICQFSEV